MTVTGLADPAQAALLDTCVLIDLPLLDPDTLPEEPGVCAVSLGELAVGVASARTERERMIRTKGLADVRAWCDPIPFDDGAATIYGELARLTIASGLKVRARRLDLMIAAIAVRNDLSLVTFNVRDFQFLAEVLDLAPVPQHRAGR